MAKHLIEALGGSGAVAKAMECSQNVVCNWAAEGIIPWRRRHKMAILAAERGIALPADFWEDRK